MPAGDELVVASFNVRNGRAFDGRNSWPFRRRSTAAAIASLDADVVGLQEVFGFQRRYLARRLPVYTFSGDGRDRRGWGEQTPVVTRADRARTVGHVTRWFQVDGGRFPRIATTAALQIGDRPLRFTSTHLDEASAQRRRVSVEQLTRWLADDPGPHIVVGDFNAVLEDDIFGPLWQAGFRSALPDDATGTSHHFTGKHDGRRIDHILVGPGITVVDGWVAHPRAGGRLPSDHWPVVARVRLG